MSSDDTETDSDDDAGSSESRPYILSIPLSRFEDADDSKSEVEIESDDVFSEESEGDDPTGPAGSQP